MSRRVETPLESFRLVECSTQVPCYICGEGNMLDAELCTYCYAPMALTHQASGQKITPSMFAVLGPSNAGKTVYLGMLLDMLSRRVGQMQISSRGAFSITLQQTTITALSRCRFPRKTPTDPDRWNWVHCQVRVPKRRRPIELILPDMAGEAILQEIEHPFTYRVVRSLLSQCFGAMVLVDASQLEQGSTKQEFFAMKLLSYLAELSPHRKHGWHRRPLAIVFTKADLSPECLGDPSQFVQRRATGLWTMCQQRFTRARFFASAVAGACATKEETGVGLVHIPLRVEPRGIVEPFQWLIEQIK
jgi:GTPase SAR1 family protein